MSRRYADAVRVDLDPDPDRGPDRDSSSDSDSVSVAVGPADAVVRADAAPAQFLWRGRLYVVRGVLAHWVEVGPWWRTASLVGAGPRRGGAGMADAAGERQVWRVEAAAGRSADPGVYDLAHDPASGRWTLARAMD